MTDFLVTYGLLIITILFGVGWLVGYWMIELDREQKVDEGRRIQRSIHDLELAMNKDVDTSHEGPNQKEPIMGTNPNQPQQPGQPQPGQQEPGQREPGQREGQHDPSDPSKRPGEPGKHGQQGR